MIAAVVFFTAVAVLSALFRLGRPRRGRGVSSSALRRVASSLPRRFAARRHVDWASALAEIARSYRGGESLMNALADQPPCSLAAHRWRLGEAPSTALRATPNAGPDERFAFAVIRAVAEIGGSGALALDRAADTIRDRQSLRAERRAHAAQARASAWVLSSIGPLFACWTVGSDRRVRGFLFGSVAGVGCLVAGIAMNAIGWWWMRRVVGGDEWT